MKNNSYRIYDKSDSLENICTFLKSCSSFILVPHVGLDGDDLGSMIALRQALIKLGKEVYLFSDDPVPYQLASIQGTEFFSND